uniref:Toprim domain-containing protein n=1 Tax=Eucampia antarctica TaxID=49252 RepID=A0A6U0TGC4_9STRA
MALQEHKLDDVSPDSETEVKPFSSKSRINPLVIVEGYFDAITLYAAGVGEVVASMGTALSLEQLEAAAECAAPNGGRIVLCLDNDEAGTNAIERICSGNLLSKVSEKSSAQFLVATLPHGIKDPAEFIESNGGIGGTNSSNDFRTNILETAVDWTDWYISQITSSYDEDATSGSKGSFTEICDRISTFLATFKNAADRTRRAYEAAGVLATSLSNKTGSSSSSLQIQLESDLLDMASRKAMVREALSRRIEKIDGVSTSTSEKISKLLKGGDFTNDSEKTSGKTDSLKTNSKRSSSQHAEKNRESSSRRSFNEWDSNSYGAGKSTGKRNSYGQTQTDPPILPHFSGFHFPNPNDAEWLGVSGNSKKSKRSLILGDLPKERVQNGAYSSWKSDDAVYFNSNEYIGGKILNKPSLQHVEGDSSTSSGNDISDLLELSSNNQILAAEDRLLRALVAFAPARNAMKTAMARNVGSHSLDFDWSNKEREWLFRSLVEYPGFSSIPKNIQENATTSELRDYLSIRADVPKDAFGKHSPIIVEISNSKTNETAFETKMTNSIADVEDINTDLQLAQTEELNENIYPKGLLDRFFTTNNDDISYTSDESYFKNKKIELTVQETVATMLKANAIMRLSKSKNHWKLAYLALSKKKVSTEAAIENLIEEDKHIFDKYFDMDIDDLSLCCEALARDTNEAMKTAHELTESAKRIGRRMLESCSSSEFEGRISSGKREELILEMNEFVASLPEDTHIPNSSGGDGDYTFGSDSYDNEIDSSYGGQRQSDTSLRENESDSSSLVDKRFVNFINSLPDNDPEMDFFVEDEDGVANDDHDHNDVIKIKNDFHASDENVKSEVDFHDTISEGANGLDSEHVDPSDYDNIFQ